MKELNHQFRSKFGNKFVNALDYNNEKFIIDINYFNK